MCMHVCECAQVLKFVCMCRPEVDVSYRFSIMQHLIFKSGAHWFGQAGWPASPRGPPVPIPPGLGLSSCSLSPN